MMPPESRDSTPAKAEHPNTNEAEESNLKNNFMQMIETLRKEMGKSFREMEDGRKDKPKDARNQGKPRKYN